MRDVSANRSTSTAMSRPSTARTQITPPVDVEALRADNSFNPFQPPRRLASAQNSGAVVGQFIPTSPLAHPNEDRIGAPIGQTAVDDHLAALTGCLIEQGERGAGLRPICHPRHQYQRGDNEPDRTNTVARTARGWYRDRRRRGSRIGPHVRARDRAVGYQIISPDPLSVHQRIRQHRAAASGRGHPDGSRSRRPFRPRRTERC